MVVLGGVAVSYARGTPVNQALHALLNESLGVPLPHFPCTLQGVSAFFITIQLPWGYWNGGSIN